MARYTTSIESSMTPSDAFSYMAAFENVAQWDPGVVEAQRLTDGPVRLGTEFRVLTKTGKRRIALTYRVSEFEEGSRLVLRAVTSTLRSVDAIRVDARDGGSMVTYEANLSLQGLLRVANPFLHATLNKIGDQAREGLRRVLNP
ncbi:MAG: SRPBCC family protein [Acidimicrobiales bacterium]